MTTQADGGLLSPAPSDTGSSHTLSDNLPVPRSHPLPAGSSKELALINYIDRRILHITGRYAKSFAANTAQNGRNAGYTDFNQVIADIDPVVDVVWISATISIQIPCLLVLAGHFRDYMHSFSFVSDSFVLARKFDLAFSRLLSDPAHATIINNTDRVRIRSLAQETRFEMSDVASKAGNSTDGGQEYNDVEEIDTDDEDGLEDQSTAMKLGKVYEKTLEILGADLASLPSANSPRQDAVTETTNEVEIIDL